ncbi:MAG: hypothetical protein NZ988_03415 [Thaumarchaeota archaeon]|nr:hypothetical protein [Candidatus Calditenuaceae archaeon]MDW8187081.1 hypothetical protein [Nitrososphaerota archaeon]
MESFIPYSRYGKLLEALNESGLSVDEAARVIVEFGKIKTEKSEDSNEPLRALVERMVDDVIARERDELNRLREIAENFNALVALFSNSGRVSHESLRRVGALLVKLSTAMEGGSVQVDARTLEKLRSLLADLIGPSIREKFVPHWMFSMVERSLKEARELLREKELETERLRRAMRDGRLSVPAAKLYVVSGLLIEEAPSRSSGSISALRCELCKEAVHVQLPVREECEEAAKSGSVFRFHCPWCGSLKDLPPEVVLAMVEGARPSDYREAIRSSP